MRFHIHLLPTYFPELGGFDAFYKQTLEQVALAEELGWNASGSQSIISCSTAVRCPIRP